MHTWSVEVQCGRSDKGQQVGKVRSIDDRMCHPGSVSGKLSNTVEASLKRVVRLRVRKVHIIIRSGPVEGAENSLLAFDILLSFK